MSTIESVELKLDNHITKTERQFEDGKVEFAKLRSSIEDNTEIVEANTRAMEALVTKVGKSDGVVEAWDNIVGAAKLGNALQKFGLWLLKWPLIGAGLYTVWKWVMNNLPS